jgi:hypothetical protein
MVMYKHTFVSAWMASILREMGATCEESFSVPIISMFYNATATSDILGCKRSARVRLALLSEQMENLDQLPWYLIGTKFVKSCQLRWAKWKLRFHASRYQPESDKVEKSLQEPEFLFLKYLHALTERMDRWNSFSNKELSDDKLPEEFCKNLGPLDPPHAEYSQLVKLKKFADSYISPQVQQTLLVVMLAQKMNLKRNPDPLHRA